MTLDGRTFCATCDDAHPGPCPAPVRSRRVTIVPAGARRRAAGRRVRRWLRRAGIGALAAVLAVALIVAALAAAYGGLLLNDRSGASNTPGSSCTACPNLPTAEEN